jgi:hypothetical protein
MLKIYLWAGALAFVLSGCMQDSPSPSAYRSLAPQQNSLARTACQGEAEKVAQSPESAPRGEYDIVKVLAASAHTPSASGPERPAPPREGEYDIVKAIGAAARSEEPSTSKAETDKKC